MDTHSTTELGLILPLTGGCCCQRNPLHLLQLLAALRRDGFSSKPTQPQPELSLSATEPQANIPAEAGFAYSTFALEGAKDQQQASASLCPSCHVWDQPKLQRPPTAAAKPWVQSFVAY